MGQMVYTLDDIKDRYLDFLKKSDCPKIENLTNWGRNRFFLSTYFAVKHCHHTSSKIWIEFNARTYDLDITQAPDFLDQHNYIAWLQQHFLTA
ncbi:MAG: hypothetical protein LKF82_09775 [Acinetobacter populi]|jgi:hypothetical protein|uniref:hypothetical protein n=1 Tax=Acinetobacter populi TaxID=1582270 RepID=UPI002356F22F|nr:hypothetical protein [Acinetobacter populi]MCH4248104.1 hypothetical protein [Acinetobacter populi]